MVLSGVVTAWRFAGWPINRSPSLVKATTEGVVRAPSLFSMTFGLPPSITATQLLVVPRSMPITFAILLPFSTRPRTRDGARKSGCGGDIGGENVTTRHGPKPFPAGRRSTIQVSKGERMETATRGAWQSLER